MCINSKKGPVMFNCIRIQKRNEKQTYMKGDACHSCPSREDGHELLTRH